MFALADEFGVSFQYDGAVNRLSAEASRQVMLGDLVVPFHVRLVGSQIISPKHVLLLFRVKGNLGIFINARIINGVPHIDLYFVNLPKLKTAPEKFFDKRYATDELSIDELGEAVVRAFCKTAVGWCPIEAKK
jgi:hypothetical protein